MTATAVDFYTRWADLMRSWGETVVFVDGCETRGASASFYDPRGGFTEHHDASSKLSGNWGSLPSIIAGRKGSSPVPGPLANLQFARDGQVAIVAMGPGNHAGTGGPKLGIPANDANRHTAGAEVANDGLGEPYSPELTRALVHGEAAWAIVAGRTAAYVFGHKEWTDRKVDPRIAMSTRRAAVAAIIANGGPLAQPTCTPTRRSKLMYLVRDNSTGAVYLVTPDGFRTINSEEEWNCMVWLLDDDRDPDADAGALGKSDTFSLNARFVEVVDTVLSRPTVHP